MRVVVTGGAGFIGSNLCRQLARSARVDTSPSSTTCRPARRPTSRDRRRRRRAARRVDPRRRRARPAATARRRSSTSPPGRVPRSVADPLASHHANATGTVKVLEAARRTGCTRRRRVPASTARIPCCPNTKTCPPARCRRTREQAGHRGIRHGVRSYGLPVLAFRFFNVFGPMQPAGHVYAAVIPAFVDAALRTAAVTVHGDGTQSRDFTFVGTVAAVSPTPCCAGHRPRAGEPGVRHTHRPARPRELLERVLGRPVDRAPPTATAGDVPHSQADNTRLRALFPDVRPTSLEQRLARTVEWMRSVRPA